jgi:N-acetylneuraminate synthase
MKVKIGNRYVGDEEPLYFVADIAANHDGDLDRALKLIELARESGPMQPSFRTFRHPG